MANTFSLRLGGWLPNISVRMVRGRTPAIPFNEAIERIREIFPQMTPNQIITELRQAGGNIERAILNISASIGVDDAGNNQVTD